MAELLRQADTAEPPPVEQQEDRGASARDLTGLQRMLDAQRDRIHQQLQELQRVVVLQCRITGTNPLAQEMAAAVSGKRPGKRPGETLTPKALKCLYNVFSIKDTITKKEAREISALSGATVTQVREFFSGQRSRVRKVVQLSHGEPGSGNPCFGLQSSQIDVSTNGLQDGEDTVSLSPQIVDSQSAYRFLLDDFHGKVDGSPGKSNAVEKAEHLINVMRKENTFTGQSQLAQLILEAHGSVVRCFMVRGGLQQMIKWLMQAAGEEQTSLIRILLKTISQLPLGSALPRQMSLLLQTVNKLRFYRAQDVASRARSLLSRWSRFFRSTQNGKMAPSTGLARTSQPAHKRSRDTASSHTDDGASKKKLKDGIMVDFSGQLADAVSSSTTIDKHMDPREESELVREVNPMRKRLGSFLIQGDRVKEKRKVQLFEEARAAVRRKDLDTAKSSSFTRPLSADDIKKAKRRAHFLNSKKPSSSRSDIPLILDSSAVPSFAQQSSVLSLHQGQLWGRMVKDAGSNIGISDVRNLPPMGDNALEGEISETVLSIDPKVSDVKLERDVGGEEVLTGEPYKVLNTCVGSVQIESLATTQGFLGLDFKPLKFSDDVKQTEWCRGTDFMDLAIIQWATPPRIALDPRWRVASGEQSTETGSQSVRLSNEQEALYLSPECIPANPEEPAERVCLFVDDVLVPEILLEALDEESQERDGCLQSPRDLEAARVRGQEADSNKLNTGTDVSGQGASAVRNGDISSFSKEGIAMSVELNMANKYTHSSELSNENKQESSPLLVSKGFDHGKPLKKVNGALDPTMISLVDPSELTLATPLDQSLEVGTELQENGHHISETFKQGKDTPSCQQKSRENVLEHGYQTAVGSSHALKAPEAEALADCLGRKDMVTQLQKGCGIANDASSENLQLPLLLDHSLNAIAGKETLGLKLSELSKEACLDMLKIVLQQLADNGKGSGADLELLSLFLKNPELVYALMSSQAESSGKGLAAKARAGEDSSAVSASSRLKDLSIQVENLVGRNMLEVVNNSREMERTGTPISLPPLHTGHVIQPISKPVAGAESQLRPPLPPMPPPFPGSLPVIDQAIQPQSNQSKVVDSTQYLQQPSPQADISRLPEDLALHNSGYDWSCSYDHPASYGQQGAGLAKSLMQTPVPTRPSVDYRSSLNEYPMSYPGSNQPTVTRASQPPNLGPLTAQTDPRVQSSMFMYGGGHGELNPPAFHVERQERAMNRKNGFSFADAPNAPSLNNLQSRDTKISAGILPVPQIAHTNHRVQPSRMMQETHVRHVGKVPVLIPDVRGSLIPPPVMGNQIPPHLNYGHHYRDQNFRHPSLSRSCPPSLLPPLPNGRGPPSFVPNSFRPQGNMMIWKPPPSHSHRGRHVRPGWREG